MASIIADITQKSALALESKPDYTAYPIKLKLALIF